MYPGCNVENAAYPSGICAERTALVSAIAAEGPNVRFDDCIVVADSESPTTPCGPCRQMMVEFGLDIIVTNVNKKG